MIGQMMRSNWRGVRLKRSATLLALFFVFVFFIFCPLAVDEDIYSASANHQKLSQISAKYKLSSKLPHRFPWKDDQECSNFSIGFLQPGSGSLVALASYPGSGNTWLRYLLESASGIFTGSVYKDLEMHLEGYWGEIRHWKDGSTLLQKTHDFSHNHIWDDFGGQGILLVRNPYKSILSKLNYLYGGHARSRPRNLHTRPEWDEFVELELKRWADMQVNWSNKHNNVLILHYEKLVSDLAEELVRAADFLGLQLLPRRLQCTLKYRLGYFKRKKQTDNRGQNKAEPLIYTQQQRQKIDQTIDRVSEELVKQGREPLPTHLYSFYRKTSSEILKDLRKDSEKKQQSSSGIGPASSDLVAGAQMLIQYFQRWYSDKKQEGSFIERLVIDKLTSITSGDMLSDKDKEKALRLFLDYLPVLQKSWTKDPLAQEVERLRAENT